MTIVPKIVKFDFLWTACVILPGTISYESLSIPSIPPTTVQTSNINGWVLIQQNFQNCNQSFYRNWVQYKTGFGNTNGNFWFGNEKLHLLTSNANWMLRVEVQSVDTMEWYYAQYSSVLISSENDFYRLQVSSYTGNAGDSFNDVSFPTWVTNGYKFTTYDSDNDELTSGNCARACGWWFNTCGMSVLNCLRNGWGTLKTVNNLPTWNLAASRMLIQRIN